MASTYETILGLILQGTGDNNNSWGTVHDNSGFKPIARAIGGVATHADTGGTLDLSGSPPPAALRQDVDYIHKFTGVLVSDLTVIMPSVSKSWIFLNQTTGAFSVLIKTSGMATPIQVPRGPPKLAISDGTTIYREDGYEVGSLRISAMTSPDADVLPCNGASYLRSQYPDLFGKIGTTYGSVDSLHFNVPDYVTSNRFLRAAGGSLSVGQTQTSQNLSHTHTITGNPGAGTLSTDAQGNHSHTANVNDPSHVHVVPYRQNISTLGSSGPGAWNADTAANSGSSTTGISVGIVATGSHAHNVTGAPSAGTLATASSGGSEVRPENAAVLFCIRY